MKNFKRFILSVFIVLGFGVLFSPVHNTSALELFPACTGSSTDPAICADKNSDFSDIILNIVQLLMYLIGILSVIMIIYGGYLYIMSAGDSGKVTKAKNTILYSVIGVIVAIISVAIVQFVVSSI